MKVKYFKEASLRGSKGAFQLVQHQGKVAGENAPETLGSVSMETIQEMRDILILAIING